MWVGRHSVVHLSPPLSPPLGCPRGHLYTNVPLACTLLASSPLLPIAPITGASKVISEFSLSHLASIPLVAPNPTGNCLHSSKERKGVRARTGHQPCCACVHVPGVIVKGKGGRQSRSTSAAFPKSAFVPLTAKLASSPERLRPIGTLGPDEGNKVGATCARERDDSGDAWDGFGTPDGRGRLTTERATAPQI